MRALALWFTMLLSCAVFAVPAHGQSSTGGAAAAEDRPAPKPEDPGETGGADPTAAPAPADQMPLVPGRKAVLLPDGTAAAPADAPLAVQQAVWAANALQEKPYRYGGGHGRFVDTGYDCSGTISFALHGGDLLDAPLDSSSFMSWGESGKGKWITVYTNPGHAYAVIAGLRLDTSAAYVRSARTSRTGRRARVAAKALERGPRWRPTVRPASGFRARHPLGL